MLQWEKSDLQTWKSLCCSGRNLICRLEVFVLQWEKSDLQAWSLCAAVGEI